MIIKCTCGVQEERWTSHKEDCAMKLGVLLAEDRQRIKELEGRQESTYKAGYVDGYRQAVADQISGSGNSLDEIDSYRQYHKAGQEQDNEGQ